MSEHDCWLCHGTGVVERPLFGDPALGSEGEYVCPACDGKRILPGPGNGPLDKEGAKP